MTIGTLDTRIEAIRSIFLPFFSMGILIPALLFAFNYNFLLYHTFIEIFVSVMALSTAVVAWNTRHLERMAFIDTLGATFIMVALLNTLHVLSQPELHLFHGDSTQMSIVITMITMHLEALGLILALVLKNRSFPTIWFYRISFLIIAMVFGFVFMDLPSPLVYRIGHGSTSIKRIFTYTVMGLFFVASLILRSKRDQFRKAVLIDFTLYILFSLIAQIIFISYARTTDQVSAIAHSVRALAIIYIYQGVVSRGLRNPLENFFSRLNKTLQELQITNSRLRIAQKGARLDTWEMNLNTQQVFNPGIMGDAASLRSAPISYEESLQRVLPQDRERARSAMQNTIDTGAELHLEIATGDSNDPVYLDIHGQLERDENGKPVRITGFMQDITTRKENELRLIEANLYLEQTVQQALEKYRDNESLLVQQAKQAAIGELIADIAHQWKQPLNVLGILLQDCREMVKEGKLDPGYLDEFIQDSFQQIKHMSQTVDEFRNFYNPSRELTSFPVYDAIQDIISLLAVQLKSANITIDIKDSFGTNNTKIQALGYPGEFKHVMMNIIGNARDALAACARDREKRISIEILRTSEGVHVFVEDNGGGIPPKIMKDLFSPYVSSKGSQGSGIGLYMSRIIIEHRMKGRISAENTENGARFIILLPPAD